MKIVEQPTVKNEAQLRAFAKRWVPWWRDRLGNRDWHIDVSYVGPNDLDTDVIGQCIPNFPDRSAKIRLLIPHPKTNVWEKNDLEEIIVHELLHINFGVAGVGIGEYTNDKMCPIVLVEQQINALASILVKLKRGSRR